jgi:hypothetical protein
VLQRTKLDQVVPSNPILRGIKFFYCGILAETIDFGQKKLKVKNSIK